MNGYDSDPDLAVAFLDSEQDIDPGTDQGTDQGIDQDVDALWAAVEAGTGDADLQESESTVNTDTDFSDMPPRLPAPPPVSAALRVVCPATQDVRGELQLEIKKRKLERVKARLAQEYTAMLRTKEERREEDKEDAEAAEAADRIEMLDQLYRHGCLLEFAQFFNLTPQDYGLKDDEDALTFLAWDLQLKADAQLAETLASASLFDVVPVPVPNAPAVPRQLLRQDVANAMNCLGAWLKQCVSDEQSCSSLLLAAEQLAQRGTQGIVLKPWWTNKDSYRTLPYQPDTPWSKYWTTGWSPGRIITIEHDQLSFLLSRLESPSDRCEALYALRDACSSGQLCFNLLFDPRNHYCFLSRFEPEGRLQAFNALLRAK